MTLAERWLGHWKGDVSGGVTSAILTIPVSMGYGILALYALGDHYVSYGILAGLYGAIFVPATAVLLGADTAMMYAPRSVVTFLLGSIVAQTLAKGHRPDIDLADVHRVLVLIFFVVFVAGLVQAAFGAFRLGGFVRYIPSPVMAGFQNAAAILILISQLDSMFGFRRHVALADIARHASDIQPLTLLVGVATAVVMWWAPRLPGKPPPAIAGLVAGAGVYYLLAALGLRADLGSVIGPMPAATPSTAYLRGLLALPANVELRPLLPSLVTGAISLSIVASLDGLLCAKTVEGITGQRIRGNAELVRLGLGNAVAACFGGIASGVNLGSSSANYKAGGRTATSVVVTTILMLLAVLVLTPVIAYIPRAVIAGLLVVVSLQLIDRWSIQILRRMLAGEFEYWRNMTVDLFVILLVATVAIAANLVAAVGIGVAVAVLSFLARMSRSLVRRAYHGDAIHSRRTRDPRLMEMLQAHGRKIAVFELEGPIFFGTAEDLANRVEAAVRDGVVFVVLDLKRINEIDSTGARILLQIHERLARAGKHLLVSHLETNQRLADFLDAMGVSAVLTRGRVFADTDRALEWAEDHLIAAELGTSEAGRERGLDQLDAMAGLSAEEHGVLREALVRRTYERGDTVVREGDTGRELYIIARGTASVTLKLAGTRRVNRLATFSAGTVFGEVALLDEQPRSATVEADEDLVCYVLTDAAFEWLAREHQSIAIKLLKNLGRELSRRLRRANQTIYEMEG
jgi:MFS superfamily sulfate permease-like transporter